MINESEILDGLQKTLNNALHVKYNHRVDQAQPVNENRDVTPWSCVYPSKGSLSPARMGGGPLQRDGKLALIWLVQNAGDDGKQVQDELNRIVRDGLTAVLVTDTTLDGTVDAVTGEVEIENLYYNSKEETGIYFQAKQITINVELST